MNWINSCTVHTHTHWWVYNMNFDSIIWLYDVAIVHKFMCTLCTTWDSSCKKLYPALPFPGAHSLELWRALGPFATSVARAHPGEGWPGTLGDPYLSGRLCPGFAGAGIARTGFSGPCKGMRCEYPWLCELWVLQHLDFVFSVPETKLINVNEARCAQRILKTEIQSAPLNSLHSSFFVSARAWLAPFVGPGLCHWKRKVIWQHGVNFRTYPLVIKHGSEKILWNSRFHMVA